MPGFAGLVVAASLLALAAPAAAGEPIGSVRQTIGTCLTHRSTPPRPLAAAAPIELDEVVSTGPASRLGIGFRDGSRLTLGENTRVRVDRYVYGRGTPTRLTAAAVGALRFISGKWGGPQDGEVKVLTGYGTVAVRGDVWAGPIDGAFGILLLAGAADVFNGGGSATLGTPGAGIMIAAPDAPPGPVRQWPQEKIARALAATALP